MRLVPVFLAALLVCSRGQAKVQELEARIAELEGEVQHLSSAKDDVEESLNALESSLDELEQSLELGSGGSYAERADAIEDETYQAGQVRSEFWAARNNLR